MSEFEVLTLYRQREIEAVETLLQYKGVEVDLYPCIKREGEVENGDPLNVDINMLNLQYTYSENETVSAGTRKILIIDNEDETYEASFIDDEGEKDDDSQRETYNAYISGDKLSVNDVVVFKEMPTFRLKVFRIYKNRDTTKIYKYRLIRD